MGRYTIVIMKCLDKIIAVFFIVGCMPAGFSQTAPNFENLKAKYPGHSSVITSDIENVLIDVSGNSYKITQEVIKQTMILKNPTNYMVTDKVFSSHFVKLLEVDAKTLLPDGNKYKIEKVNKFTEQKNSSDYIFYDEVVAKTFVYPAVQPGAITSVRYVQELSDPHMLGSFFFKWHIPCELSQLTVKADKKARLKYKIFNAEAANIEFSVQEKGKYNIYTWTAKNMNASDYEPDAPNPKYYYPHITYFIENSIPDNNSAESIGLASLYQYYHKLVKDLNTNPDAEIQKMVELITANDKTEEDKVKSLFYWVQDNITYVAFEDGMQGFIPEPASQVFTKRYGDCKGMSSLLSYMLKLAGIKSYLTWIGTRDIPYLYTEIPSKVTDNHMIVTYYRNNQPVFLDATNKHLLFGLPSAMIQGKQALVGDGASFKVEQVPVVQSDVNTICDSASFTLAGNSISGKGVMNLTGYEKNTQAYYLNGKESKQIKDHLLALLMKGNNKFFLDTFSITNLANREKPLSVAYNFRVGDYYKEIDHEIYINLCLNKAYNNQLYDSIKRNIPVECNNMHFYKSVTEFTIPNGYEISYLPKSTSSSSDKFSFTITYRIEGNKVIQVKEINKNFLVLFPSEFAKWNRVALNLSQAYRDVLILKKKS